MREHYNTDGIRISTTATSFLLFYTIFLMPAQLLASAAFFVLLWAKIGSVEWEENWEIGDRSAPYVESNHNRDFPICSFKKLLVVKQHIIALVKGTPIGPMDMLIAAHAKAEDLVLVTNNTREFERVEDLEVEDWTKK